MPQGRSGLSALTADNSVLDAGEVWFNINKAALEATGWDDAIAAAVRVGGTRGGNTFSPGRVIREMPVDGSVGPVRGFARRAGSRPALTVNMLELTVENLGHAIAAATTSATGGTTDLTKIAGSAMTDGHYIPNVAIATTLKGEDEPVVILIENALVLDAPEFSFADEDEMVLTVTFVGHTLSSDPNVEAFAIYHSADHVLSVTINEADQDLVNTADLQLTLTFVKTGTASESVTYESSNVAAATVNATGLVSAVANGVTIVTVTSVANPFASDSITITVVDP
jgi:hypothetical protein